MGDGMTLRLLLQVAIDPLAFGAVEDRVDARLVRRQRAVVEVGGVMDMAGAPSASCST
jgi:hypothetical protein